MTRYYGDRAHQAWRILQIAFIILPIIAGLDKFFNFLTFWPGYLSPPAFSIMRENSQNFMMLAGLIEIIVGIGVIFKPKIFGYIVAIWLLLIVVNLLVHGRYLDVALRDLGLALAAFALGKLSEKYEHGTYLRDRDTHTRDRD